MTKINCTIKHDFEYGNENYVLLSKLIKKVKHILFIYNYAYYVFLYVLCFFIVKLRLKLQLKLLEIFLCTQ